MLIKRNSRSLVWIVVGALGLFFVFGTLLFLRGERDPVAQIALKEKRLALVNAIRLSLAAASEALNNAVLATREQDSKAFIDEARTADADIERSRTELEQLSKSHVNRREIELMERAAQSLLAFQQIEKQLFELAVQNSNRKALELAFGPAMDLVKQIDQSLGHIIAGNVDSAADSRLRVVQLADEARIAILSTQILILPHIAEASDLKMDEFEVQLSEHARKIRESLAELKPLLSESDQAKIATTTSVYAEFEKLKSQIIALSRQNTDLRAVTLALTEKRHSMLECQDALIALEQAIRAEPITSTIPSGRSP